MHGDMSVRLTARRGAIPEPDGQVGECLWDSLMRLRRETRKTADGPAGVHTSAPGFRPRMIVLGSLRFPMACVSLGPSGVRRSCCTAGKSVQNRNSLTSGVKENPPRRARAARLRAGGGGAALPRLFFPLWTRRVRQSSDKQDT